MQSALVVKHASVTKNEPIGSICFQGPIKAKKMVANNASTIWAAHSVGEWKFWQALAVIECRDDEFERIFSSP